MKDPLAHFVSSHGKRIEVVTLPSKEPTRISRRRERFVKLPMWWMEKLAQPLATAMAHQIAWQVLYLNWKHHHHPFKLPNGVLKYDGVSRQSKWRALADLERRGLITIQRRPGKSPIVHVQLLQ